ncbi:DNA repair protein RecO [Bombilactobacillus folatiphilus]|uniref:DNA repair protein RecO n=1 Tax=Bombilactobacillus folatiphilus TaxID=2923362 RepID=A0ABY4P733_9LACO|nr:DNA repair protein RecO [Bombilactobacillus folatiphilus]UQS81528.1 DNA repair protein RecO [Bombilactobacillus folatiphilus]
MVLKRNQNFAGLVLRTQDYHENDQLVWLLTDKFGIKTFLMRGVKKVNAKNRSLSLPFTYGNYQGVINEHGFSYLTAALKLQQFQYLIQDIKANAYVTYQNDLLLRAFDKQLVSQHWFTQILTAQRLVNQQLDPEIITNVLEVQLLKPFGVAPNLRSCVIGGETQGIFDYSLSLGGLLCSKHWSHDEHRLHLIPKTVAYLRLFASLDLQRVGKISVSENVKVQLRKTLDLLYKDNVGVYPKSKKFIDQMYQWQL